MITAIIDVCYLPYMEIASNAELSVAGSSFFKYTCLNAVSRTFIVLYSASLHDQNAIWKSPIIQAAVNVTVGKSGVRQSRSPFIVPPGSLSNWQNW